MAKLTLHKGNQEMSAIVVIGDKTIAEHNAELDIQADAIVKKIYGYCGWCRRYPRAFV